MIIVTEPLIFVLDKGYDSESVHQMIRKNNTISMIPTINRDCLISRTRGRYRKLMRRSLMNHCTIRETNVRQYFQLSRESLDQMYHHIIIQKYHEGKRTVVPCVGLQLSQNDYDFCFIVDGF